MFKKTLLVFVDAQECRRVAFANLFSSLLNEKNVFVLNFSTVDIIKAAQSDLAPMLDDGPLFILNIGAQSFSDASITRDLANLRAMAPECLVLLIQESDWEGSMERALSVGVRGVISMTMPPKNAVAAIEVALMGGTFFPRAESRGKSTNYSLTSIAQNPRTSIQPSHTQESDDKGPPTAARKIQDRILSDDQADATSSSPVQLSRRQLDVVRALESGMSNKEIARALKLSEATIKIHVRNLMRKYGVGNRTQVAVLSKHGGSAETNARIENQHLRSL